MSQDAMLGKTVLYYQGDDEAPNGYDKTLWQGNNGTRFHPAIVTRVHSETMVNLLVCYDATGTMVRREVTLLGDENFTEGTHCVLTGWRHLPVDPVA